MLIFVMLSTKQLSYTDYVFVISVGRAMVKASRLFLIVMGRVIYEINFCYR